MKTNSDKNLTRDFTNFHFINANKPGEELAVTLEDDHCSGNDGEWSGSTDVPDSSLDVLDLNDFCSYISR
jgi:hypothetical protein